MRILGCDLHASHQTIALLDRDTGEISERITCRVGDPARIRAVETRRQKHDRPMRVCS